MKKRSIRPYDLEKTQKTEDVEITKDIFLYGKKNGHIFFEKIGCGIVKLPVKWNAESIIKKLSTNLQ
jgi:hypothetical protein